MPSPISAIDPDSAEFYRAKAVQARELALVSTDPATAEMLTAEADELEETANYIDEAEAAESHGGADDLDDMALPVS